MIKLNGEVITPTIFPDGTSQVWKINIPSQEDVIIEWKFENESELIHVLQLNDLLKAELKQVHLSLPYLPYARQDKVISNDTTFALNTFANIINSNFNYVTTIDVHSYKARKLIPVLYDAGLDRTEVNNIIRKLKIKHLTFPDGGAHDRYGFLFINNGTHGPSHIIGSKIRNQETGYIEKYNYDMDSARSEYLGISDREHLSRPILIIDDICDGGMTFKLLAEQLIKDGATDVNLYVTHGIFSKGLQTLRDSGIKRIFTHEGEINE